MYYNTSGVSLSMTYINELMSLLLFISSESDGNTATPPTIPECHEGNVNSRIIRNDFSDIQFSVVGPVEFCVNGQYESVCDIGWDELDAQAVCREQVASDTCK